MLQFIAVYQWWLLTTGWLQRFNSPLAKKIIESYLEIAMANSKIVKVPFKKKKKLFWRLVWKTFKSPKKTRFKLRFLCAAQRGKLCPAGPSPSWEDELCKRSMARCHCTTSGKYSESVILYMVYITSTYGTFHHIHTWKNFPWCFGPGKVNEYDEWFWYHLWIWYQKSIIFDFSHTKQTQKIRKCL